MKKKFLSMMLAILCIVNTIPVYATEVELEVSDTTTVSGNDIDTLDEISAEGTEIINEDLLCNRAESFEDNDMECISAETENSNVTYPALYDVRTSGGCSEIRDQMGGTCYIYAAMSTAESNLIKHGYVDNSVDLSEMQYLYFGYKGWKDPLGYYTDYLRNSTLPLFSLYSVAGLETDVYDFFAKYCGPIYESDMPMVSMYKDTVQFNEDIRNIDYINSLTYDESLATKNYWHLNKIRNLSIYKGEAYKYIDNIKELITKYGGVSCGIHWNGSYTSSSPYSYNGEEDASYYEPHKDSSANHAVEIVGWDDNYSMLNFKTSPDKNGAWLVKNSNGHLSYCDSKGIYFAGSGYYWVSYYDKSLESFSAIDFSTNDNYQNLYSAEALKLQCDVKEYAHLKDVSGNSIDLTSYTTKANADGTELLKAVMGETVYGENEVLIYIKPEIEDGVILSEPYYTQTYFHEDAGKGKTTIPLEEEIPLEEGTEFSVAIQNNNLNKCTPCSAMTNNVSAGENTINAPTYISFGKSSLTLKEDSKEKLSVSYSPNASKGCVFTSSNANVVKIDKDGNLTPVGYGTSTITAKAIYGNATASCEVSVKCATVSVKEFFRPFVSINQTQTVDIDSALGGIKASDFTWSSLNTNIATVDGNGTVQIVGKGQTTIIGKLRKDLAYNDMTVGIGIDIPKTYVTDIVLKTSNNQYISSANYGYASDLYLQCYALPQDADNTNITITSNNPDISIGNGYVISQKKNGKKTNKATITATTKDGTNISKSITVTFENGDDVVPNTYIPPVVEEKKDSGVTVIVENKQEKPKTETPKDTKEEPKKPSSKPVEIELNHIQYQIKDGEATLWMEDDVTKANVVIPDSVEYDGVSYKVTVISSNAFYNRDNIKSVKIGKNVKIIEKGAFEKCDNLSKVTLGSKLTKIEDKAFANCIKLKSITIPKNVTSIGSKAFYGCKNLKTVDIKSVKVKTFGKKIFTKASKKLKITVPKKVKKKYTKTLKTYGKVK